MTPFDPAPYVHSPTLDVPATLALTSALLAAAPPHPSPRLRKLLDELRAASAELASRYAQSPAPSRDLRVIDHAVDHAWTALYGRLDTYLMLPEDRFPRTARARELLDLLFPNASRAFLQLAFAKEWAESEKRLQIIDRDHLQADLDALCGPEFLDNLRVAHAAYGIALGITEAAPAEVNLGGALDQARKAIGRYTFHLASLADEDDAAGLATLRAALQPVDEARAAAHAPKHKRPEASAPAALPSGGDTP